jgi:hypothetical protein
MRREYPESENRLGRGVVFHVAPANVPINFAYTLVAGLLSGCANIVRVPSANFAQVSIIADVIDLLLKQTEHRVLYNHIRLVRYDRSSEDITERFSRICDVRVIWGGDNTIADIRRHNLSARAFDITFADRYSICIVGAEEYVKNLDAAALARKFFNDTYLFDQNACTAPHLILWHGEQEFIQQARGKFWWELHRCLKGHYTLEARSAVNKLTRALRFVAMNEGSSIISSGDNLIIRIELGSIKPGIEDWRSNCGFFFEYELKNLNEILPVISRQYQTMSYAGLNKEELNRLILDGHALGIDRIVPLGRTMEFSLNWDGCDLIRSMSRYVTVL